MAAAVSTSSDTEDWYIPDQDLIDDVTVDQAGGTLAEADAALADVYHQQLITNRLLGVIVVFLIVYTVWGVFRYFQRLIGDKIFYNL